jgi:hypothetical protein
MFVFERETTSIAFAGEPAVVLKEFGVRASVAGEGEIELLLKSANPATPDASTGTRTEQYKLLYEDSQGRIRAELHLSANGPFMAVRVDAVIRNDTAYHAQRTFAAEGGIRIVFRQLDGLQGLLAASRHKEWWTRPHFDTDLRLLPARTQSLLWKTDEGYGYMLPVCDELYRTDLTGCEDGLAVQISTFESGRESIRTVSFVLGAGIDPYLLAADAAAVGFAERDAGGVPKEEKAYPEILEYLGWCSWDAFYADVDEKGLEEKAAELGRLGLPVRWFMIDDGWSDVKDRKLASFGADKEKFPGGLGRTVRRLKDEHGIRWVGAWHNIAGYWGGIDPEGEAFAEARDYVHHTRSGRWIPSPELARNFGFWQLWHSRLKRQGIDFVKVDNQSSLYSYMGGEQSIAKTAHAFHAGLEASVALHFDGCMINCMGMASENVWHRPLTSVSRSSNDFLPKIADGFGEHALQNAYNSVYHGPFYWGDWDMFWTGHHDAVPHMTLRAVSGGPVYFSDGPGRTNPDIIRPLVYGDGKIIRCERGGQPTKEWLTVNPLITPGAFKVWNTAGGAGIVAAFHVYDGDRPVEGEIGPDDIPGLAGKAFVVYDSFRGTAHRLRRGETVPVRLERLEAALFLIVPAAIGPFTAIGLTDKLVAADAVLETAWEGGDVQVRLKDGGTFSFVSERKPLSAFVDGKPADVVTADEKAGLYRVFCPTEDVASRRETVVRIEL